MSQLNKQQLELVNQTNFPNNNTQFITPDKLREMNTDIIDSMVDEISYNVDSASFSSSNDNLQDQINTLVVSGSGIFIQNEGTLLGIATDLDFVGDAVNTTLMGSSAKISIQAVTTSSFNQYTQSNDSKVNSLISKTGSFATTGSNTFVGSQIVNGSITASVGLKVTEITNNGTPISIESDTNVNGDLAIADILYVNHIEEESNNAGIIYKAGTPGHMFTGSINVSGSLKVNNSFICLFSMGSFCIMRVFGSYLMVVILSNLVFFFGVIKFSSLYSKLLYLLKKGEFLLNSNRYD